MEPLGTRPKRTWIPLGSRCLSDAPPTVSAERAEVTPAVVLAALRRIGLPAVRVHTQPEDNTLAT